jgi:DNA-binding transcriptional ArsR family regulator
MTMTKATLPPQPDWMLPGTYERLYACVTDEWRRTTEIVGGCGMSPSQAAAHLKRIAEHGLIESRVRNQKTEWRRKQ